MVKGYIAVIGAVFIWLGQYSTRTSQVCTTDGSNQGYTRRSHEPHLDLLLLLRVMDSSGFLSPKANAFSIAHLIDRARLADLAFLHHDPNYHWNSQVLLREMEGTSFECVYLLKAQVIFWDTASVLPVTLIHFIWLVIDHYPRILVNYILCGLLESSLSSTTRDLFYRAPHERWNGQTYALECSA